MRPRRALRGPWRIPVAGGGGREGVGRVLLRLEGGVGGSWGVPGKGILQGPGGLGMGMA